MKLRQKYVDVAKLIAIFAVIFDHSQYYVPISGNWFSILRIWLFGFYLQVFFLAAGLTGKAEPLGSVKNWYHFLEKLFKSILVPYLLWCFILGTRTDSSFFRGIIYGTQTSLSNSGTDSVLWFLPALFCAKVCFQLVIDLMFGCMKRASGVFLVVVAVYMAFTSFYLGKYYDNRIIWGMDIGLMGTSLMIAGYLFRDTVESIRRMKTYKQVLVLCLCIVGALFFSYANMPFYLDNGGTVIYHCAVWMAHSQYGANCIFYIASSLLSCTVILILSFWLERIPLLAWLGQHTFVLMAAHGKIYGFVAQMPAIFPVKFVPIIAAIVTTLLCAPVALFIGRFAPVLEGKCDSRVLTK